MCAISETIPALPFGRDRGGPQNIVNLYHKFDPFNIYVESMKAGKSTNFKLQAGTARQGVGSGVLEMEGRDFAGSISHRLPKLEACKLHFVFSVFLLLNFNTYAETYLVNGNITSKIEGEAAEVTNVTVKFNDEVILIETPYEDKNSSRYGGPTNYTNTTYIKKPIVASKINNTVAFRRWDHAELLGLVGGFIDNIVYLAINYRSIFETQRSSIRLGVPWKIPGDPMTLLTRIAYKPKSVQDTENEDRFSRTFVRNGKPCLQQ